MPPQIPEVRFDFRPFDKDTDLPRLARLLAEIERVDQAGEDISEETLVALLNMPGHDPVRDRQVAISLADREQLAGFCSVWKMPQNTYADIYAGVHPAFRRQGIGTILLQHALTGAQELQAQDILASVDTLNQEAIDFLRKRTFARVSAYTRMRLDSSKPLPPPTLPGGYSLRPFDPDKDFTLLLAMYNQAFQGLRGHWEHVMAEDLQNILHGQDLTGIFLLFTQAGEVIGTCRGEKSEHLSAQRGRPTGYLDFPGVIPAYRGRDLYLPQLLHATRWVRNQAALDIELESWGDDPLIIAQARGLGFEVLHQQDTYQWQGNHS